MGRTRSSASSADQLPRGARIDADRVERVVRFFERCLIHVKGKFAGQPFVLEPWQRAEIIEPLFGAVDRRGVRWFREGLLGISRKNGKSALSAGLALYALTADDEWGAEVYSLAGSRDQARIVFATAAEMAKASPVLRPHLRIYRSAIEFPARGGVYRTLSADAGLAHGYSPSFAIVDELHVHKNPDLFEAIRTGISDARREPMMISITTAGHDYESICRHVYERGVSGKDPRLFFRWWEPATGADVDDVKAWRTANPASWVSIESLRDKRRSLPENSFRRLHLNQWTRQENRVLPLDKWDECRGKPTFPEGSEVVITVDVAPRGRDRTAVGLLREDEQGRVHTRVRTFEADPDLRMVDYDLVENLIREYARAFDVIEVAYDPYYFDRSALKLEAEGIPMTAFAQDDARMVPASQALFAAILEGRIIHDGDPVLRAHIENAGAKETSRGWRLHKAKSTGPIDAAIVLAMGVHRLEHVERRPVPRFFGLTGE